MVAQPIFMTNSAAAAGAVGARHASERDASERHVAAAVKCFPDIVSQPLFCPADLGIGHFTWWRDYKAAANPAKGVSGDRDITPDRVAALIAWALVVRVGELVKDGAKRRRLRRSSILDKFTNANRVLSKRSRPLSQALGHVSISARVGAGL